MEKLIKDLILVVPDEMQVRNQIRRKVDDYFAKNIAMPPVSYEKLDELADKLIQLNSWAKKYHAFTMICCGNAIWRNVVESIPFNRRILLLPQCLKSSIGCKADFDQFGLLCKNCGKCSIPHYIDEAEKLGYIVLVSEGTTVTTQLIENGKVDAVIGVGCMEVLQKMYNSVQKFSVPGIGIPLQNCGCVDTSVDTDWIMEELYHLEYKEDFTLLNLNQIKSKTLSIFEENKLKSIFGSSENEIENIAIKSLLSGGNRYRVFLAALTYEAFCKQPNSETLSRLALSVECFHKASLIHDDIEDNDLTRYGKDTIHSEHGVPIAINTGDMLIGEGYRLIAEADISPEIALRSFQLISQGHRTLALGQGTELLSTKYDRILSLDEILKVFEQKTATAFKVSLLLGATIGGADSQSLKLLDDYSHNIGIAYQIMDDLIDYQSNNGDIEKRKFSILLSILYGKSDIHEKENLTKCLKLNDYNKIYQLIDNYKIKEQTTVLLKEYIQNAKSSIDNLQNAGLRIALYQILGKMFRDYI